MRIALFIINLLLGLKVRGQELQIAQMHLYVNSVIKDSIPRFDDITHSIEKRKDLLIYSDTLPVFNQNSNKLIPYTVEVYYYEPGYILRKVELIDAIGPAVDFYFDNGSLVKAKSSQGDSYYYTTFHNGLFQIFYGQRELFKYLTLGKSYIERFQELSVK
jgi:hypothetical protein